MENISPLAPATAYRGESRDHTDIPVRTAKPAPSAREKARLRRMIENRRLLWRTLLTYALFIATTAIVLVLLINWLTADAWTRALERFVRGEAALTTTNPELIAAWQAGDFATVDALVTRWAHAGANQIAATTVEGQVVADSADPGEEGSDLSGALELRQAISHGYGRAVRPAGPENVRTIFIALPISQDGAPLGILRWSIPSGTLNADLTRLRWLASGAILAGAVVLFGALAVEQRRRAAVIQRLTAMVDRALDNDFGGHVLNNGMGEVNQLAQATNRLVDKYRKATKRRAREKDRLNTVLTHISTGALILNELGRVRLINPAAAALLRTTPEKAERQSFVQVVWDHRIAEVWQRRQKSGMEESESIELSPDRFLRITVTPFLGGDANGYLVVIQDLSNVRRLEKVRRDFVSNVSHELRTPLASLGALVDTLRDGALDDPPAAQRFLDRMDVEVEKMTQMVQELLELSRIESGQVPLRLNSASLSQIVQPAVDRLATQAERSHLTLKVEIPADLPPVIVDLERVQQVVINLVHNAIKFTPAGGTIWVTASADAQKPEEVTVAVRDTGAGIATTDQPRIFERFYKSDRSRSSGGTGLGLAIAKHMVQAHGGEIWVQSRENEGSTFFFTLPADLGDSAETPADTGLAPPEVEPMDDDFFE